MKWLQHQQVKLKKLTNLDWKQTFKVGQYQVFGLDIGSSAVKMVQLQKNNGDYTVVAAGISDIAVDEGAEEDSGLRKINILNAIYQCLQSSGIQTKLAVCGVRGPESVVRYFTFPTLTQEEIDSAVVLEAKQICPFNIDDGAVDYQLVSGTKKNISGYLVAATNKLLKEKTRFAEDAGFNSAMVDVDGLALLNCFRNSKSQEPKDEINRPTAILNVGNSYATLAITSDDNMPFIRDLNYAGKAIIENIALKNNISPKEVERTLLRRENQDKIKSGLRDDLETVCHKLITDVSETLRYYCAWKKVQMVEKIYVCGGFALIDGFVNLLNSQLPAAAVLWNPFDQINCDASATCADILRRRGPAMAVAAGLAMRTI